MANLNRSILSLLEHLWAFISPKRRKQFALLLGLMLMASLAEIVSIGAVLPFLGMLTMPERVFVHPVVQPIIQELGLTSPIQLLLPLTLVFIVAVLVTGAMRLLLLWTGGRLTAGVGADISMDVYRRTLYQPYAVHCSRNSSELINGISSKTGVTINIIGMVITLLTSIIMLIGIMIALFSINPFIALSAFGGFGLLYWIIMRLARNQLLINSRIVANESTQLIKAMQEGLGGIRDVLIDASQNAYCQIFRNADLPLRRVQASNSFINASPRYAMEAFGMVVIAIFAYFISQQIDGVAKVIPTLGALAVGAQRLLPVFQQAYASWTYIKSSQDMLQDTLMLLDQPLPEYANQPMPHPIIFKRNICLKDINFRYSSKMPYVLKHVNLNIEKGSRIGFIGTTGSGKSTLIDIVMGLLQPTDGSLMIDNQVITTLNHRAWQAHIAHVPQAIYLADSSIEENIAFGVPKNKIDHDRVRVAAKKAQIDVTIESLTNGYQTSVGERGIRLSGGQRQRIGIARALYKQADVIIFDEATSALDNETEDAVMEAIEGLSKDLTLLIIAHRLTTLKNCTKIVSLSNGQIVRTGSYENLVNQSKSKALINRGKGRS